MGIIDKGCYETKDITEEKSDASIEDLREIETINVKMEPKDTEIPEVCIEKQELEPNEKFPKISLTTEYTIFLSYGFKHHVAYRNSGLPRKSIGSKRYYYSRSS